MNQNKPLEEIAGETPEQREKRILTARVLELARNYVLAVNNNERAKTDKEASEMIYSFLFRGEEQDGYWDLYLKETGRLEVSSHSSQG